MNPRIVRIDWPAFHAHVERLAAQHKQRPEAEAVAASLAAFRRWGVTPPASFVSAYPAAVAVGVRSEIHGKE